MTEDIDTAEKQALLAQVRESLKRLRALGLAVQKEQNVLMQSLVQLGMDVLPPTPPARLDASLLAAAGLAPAPETDSVDPAPSEESSQQQSEDLSVATTHSTGGEVSVVASLENSIDIEVKLPTLLNDVRAEVQPSSEPAEVSSSSVVLYSGGDTTVIDAERTGDGNVTLGAEQAEEVSAGDLRTSEAMLVDGISGETKHFDAAGEIPSDQLRHPLTPFETKLQNQPEEATATPTAIVDEDSIPTPITAEVPANRSDLIVHVLREYLHPSIYLNGRGAIGPNETSFRKYRESITANKLTAVIDWPSGIYHTHEGVVELHFNMSEGVRMYVSKPFSEEPDIKVGFVRSQGPYYIQDIQVLTSQEFRVLAHSLKSLLNLLTHMA